MSLELMKAFLSFLATAVFFAWIFFNPLTGLIVLAVSSIATLIIAWIYGNYSIALVIFLFLIVSVIAHYLYSKIQNLLRQASVKIEELQKNNNILTENMSSHKGVHEALKRKLHRFFQLKEFTRCLSKHLHTATVAEIVADNGLDIIGKANSCCLYMVDTQKQQLSLAAVKQKGPHSQIKNKNGDIFDSWIIRQRQPLLIEDVRKDYRFDLANVEIGSLRSLISAPITISAKVLGSIRLNSNKPNTFLSDDLRLLDVISNIAAVSLENTLLYERTKELAIKDSVTGAYVQKFFKERLAEEVIKALKGKHNVSVLLLDIDFFKVYNDKFGHTPGDIVLKKVTKILNQIAPGPDDIVARYGGEEFAIILINKNKPQAVQIAEAVRKKIEDEIFVLRREKTSITMSIGVANCPDDATAAEDIIKIADDCLYTAKKTGRNRVINR